MASALLQALAMGPRGPSVTDRYEQGVDRGMRLDEILRGNEARQFIGPAVQGNKGALAQLLGLAPELGLQVNRNLEAAADRDEDRAWRKTVFDAGENYKRQYLDVLQQRADQAGTGGQRSPPGYRPSADGNLEAIPGGPADPKVKTALKGPMSASMLKLKRETETGIVDLQNTKAVLGRAMELAPQAFSGMGASTRAYLGSRLPDGVVPDFIADKAGSDATTEFGNIMSMEAIQSMSNSLKGATTDFELRKFEQILSDPSVPANIKVATIKRMMALADSKLALEQQRLDEFGSEMPQADPSIEGQGFNEGDYFGSEADIPEGAVVVDDDGVAFQKINGKLVPVQ